MIRILLLAAVVGTATVKPALAAVQVEVAAVTSEVLGAGNEQGSQDEALYAQGSKAMDEQRWADAVSAFDRAAAAKGKRADASLYWKAYSLEKLGRKDEARTTCDGLQKAQPASTWNRECAVLRVRSSVDVDKLMVLSSNAANLKVNLDGLRVYDYRDYANGDGPKGYGNRTTSEDDIKLLALNSLMRQDPAKALPLLNSFIHSDKPLEVRRQALFVLSRSKEPQAQTILTEIATNKNDPKMQREAVNILAVGRGKDAGPTLVEVYRGSTDAGVKRAALNGLFIAHDAPRLVELARSEKDLNMKRDIVSQLALMKDQVATDYMLELLK